MSERYTTLTKMSVLFADKDVLPVLERLGLGFGFGDANVAEVCRINGFPADLFVAIANLSIGDEFEPDLSSFGDSELAKVKEYVKSSHSYYAKHAVPHLHSLIHKTLNDTENAFAAPVNKFFDELVERLDAHFVHEEKVFSRECDADDDGEEHLLFLEKLDDLKNIVVKYLPDTADNSSRYEMLRYLLEVEKDMRNHVRIEESLFKPLLESLSESAADGKAGDSGLADASDVLSQREKEILASVAKGKTNKEIADEHFISINTVITHRKNITKKTGINSIAGLTVYAILNHIIEI